MTQGLHIGSYSFASRLLVGTGRYADEAVAYDAIIASGAEVVTAAVRRMPAPTLYSRNNIRLFEGQQARVSPEHASSRLQQANAGSFGNSREAGANIFSRLREKHITILPNSAGCYTAEEAVRILRLGRELVGHNLCKLEVIGDRATLLPDEQETIRAARLLTAEGFEVMAYTTANLAVARQLEEAGCAAVMPLAAPIGSGLGLRDPDAIAAIAKALCVPVLVDAGIGAPSDAALAMELGCDGVLLNTAIAEAGDPVAMAEAFRLAVQAGRIGFEAGRMKRRNHAVASSPPLAQFS